MAPYVAHLASVLFDQGFAERQVQGWEEAMWVTRASCWFEVVPPAPF